MATPKQKIAIKKVLNGKAVKHAMEEAGYAPSTANTTGKLTRSKGWAELTDKYISDKALAKVHKEGLEATTWYQEGLGKGETVLVEKPDYSVRHKYLESGYKLKGRYQSDKDINKTLIVVIANQSAERYGISTPQEPRDSSE